MLWSRRALFALPLVLAGCGFTPVYGPGSAAPGFLSAIEVQEQTSREGFLLVQRLEERLGRPAVPQYRLLLELTVGEAGLAVTPEGETERFQLIGSVVYRLQSVETGAIVSSRGLNDFTGYSSSGSTIATLAAREDATERLMVILADEIVVLLQTTELPG